MCYSKAGYECAKHSANNYGIQIKRETPCKPVYRVATSVKGHCDIHGKTATDQFDQPVIW